MRRHQSLLQYHLQSALELAREDKRSMVEYFATMAMLENVSPEAQSPNAHSVQKKTTA